MPLIARTASLFPVIHEDFFNTCFSLGVTCGFLLSPENGQVSIFSLDSSVGTVATYECTAGFIISGSSSRTCEADGNWSGIEPVCERELYFFRSVDFRCDYR